MSTSLLYHGFGIWGIEYQRTEYSQGKPFFCRLKTGDLRCPSCGGTGLIHKGTFLRKFRLVPIGKKAAFMLIPVHRVHCRKCGGFPIVLPARIGLTFIREKID